MELDKLTAGERMLYDELVGKTVSLSEQLYDVRLSCDESRSLGECLSAKVGNIETTWHDSAYGWSEEFQYIKDTVEKLRLVLIGMDDRIKKTGTARRLVK